jgi:formyl-CoA transferase
MIGRPDNLRENGECRVRLDFKKTKTAFRRHAPRVGEDGVEVLSETGLSDAQIEALRADGALVLP